MAKRKRNNKYVRFFVGLFAAFLPTVLIMLLTKSIFTAWILLFCAIALLMLLRFMRIWQSTARPFFWFFALLIGFASPIFGRPDPALSFSGTLSRETLRFVTRLPFLSDTDMLTSGADFICFGDKWSPPKGYLHKQLDYHGVSLELLAPKGGTNGHVVLLLHGGSFILGYNNIYRNLAVRYSELGSGAAVLSVDYRTAPEHTHPTALLDSLEAWDYLVASGYDSKDIIVVGDSAGGNLALSLTASLVLRKGPVPAAVICLSPWADLDCAGDSYKYNLHNDPTFGLPNGKNDDERGSGLSTLYAGDTSFKDPLLSPVYGSFEGFPPILLHVGTTEMLESDSLTIFEKAADAHVDVTLLRFHGMFHAFHMLRDLTPESKAAWAQIGDFLTDACGLAITVQRQ